MEKKYSCLIIDDEVPAHKALASHLSKCPELIYSGSAYNGQDALCQLKERAFDIVFLDIEMPLISGLEVLHMLPKRPATIITTAYTEHAFDAYQLAAVDYLLKPVTFSRFLNAIEKAKQFSSQVMSTSFPEILTIKSQGTFISIQVSNIVYIQSIGNYVKFFLINAAYPLIGYSSLKDILQNLSPLKFIQTHKSYVVNKACLQRREKDAVILSGEIKIPVGRKFEILVRQN